LSGAPKFVSTPNNSIAVMDQPAKFECLVDSAPKAKVSWFLNGRELTAKDNVKFEIDAKTSANCLTIAKVSAMHIGSYSIKASNSVGEVEHTFGLDMIGKVKTKQNSPILLSVDSLW